MIDLTTPTRLLDLQDLARRARVGRVLVKAEGERPLGNFKVLGGMTAGLRALERAGGTPRLVCASDGNHGLAVAAAARQAGAPAAIYLPASASPERIARIEAAGAAVVLIDGTYDDAVEAAADAARRGEGLLIPDTSPDVDDPVVRDVMDGYRAMTDEIVSQLDAAPTHLFLQAGVGGLAAAVAEGLKAVTAPRGRVVVVEPARAACVAAALAAGRPVRIDGGLDTCAEMLSCGLASAPALQVLLRHGASAVAVSESQLLAAVGALEEGGGPASTPSGAAGLAGLLHVAAQPDLREAHGLDDASVVLLVATEAALSA